jgi:hypothetical protein
MDWIPLAQDRIQYRALVNPVMLPTWLLAGFAEPISSTLKMEAICSSETSVET